MSIWLGYLIIFLVAFFSLTGILQMVFSTPLAFVTGLTKQPQLVHINAFIAGFGAWVAIAWIWSSVFSQSMPLVGFLLGLAGLGASLILGGSSLTYEGRVTLIAEIWGLIVTAIFFVLI